MKKLFCTAKKFFKEHWVDILVISAIIAFLVWGAITIYVRFNFAKKWQFFYEYFFANNGYKKLVTGLKNTAIISIQQDISKGYAPYTLHSSEEHLWSFSCL